MNQEQEQQLVKIVRLANTQIQEFKQEINGKGSAILLVGTTGSGKSTLFNFLIGAQFKAKQGSQYFELELESNSEKYSVMKEGLTSVTKVPKCFYQQQYKSLIVDFPGFNDTNGEIDEIVIQSLFNKITSRSDVKIVLVNNQPQVDFSRRGVDLQDFLNQVLRNQIVKLDNITLLMNRFSKQIPDEEIIAKWQTEIEKKFGNKVGKILIQRVIRKAEDINEYLSDQQREKIWKSIIETPQFKLHPFKFKNSTLINNYLIESINRIIFQTFQELDSLLSQQKDLSLEQLVELLKWYQNINRLIKDSTLENLSNWINDYLNHLQQISECNVQDFLSIYEFFFDFQNELDGYQQIKSTLETISRSCQITIQNIENTNRNLRSLEKEKKEKENEIIKRKTAEEETKTVKIELNQIKRDLDQAVENFKNEEKEKNKAIKETNEVITQLEDTQNQRDEANKLKEKAEQEKEQAQNETEKIKTQLETTEIEMDNAKKEMGQAQELQKKAQEETNTVKQQLEILDAKIIKANKEMDATQKNILAINKIIGQEKQKIQEADQSINNSKTQIIVTKEKKKKNEDIILDEKVKKKLAQTKLQSIDEDISKISLSIIAQEKSLNEFKIQQEKLDKSNEFQHKQNVENQRQRISDAQKDYKDSLSEGKQNLKEKQDEETRLRAAEKDVLKKYQNQLENEKSKEYEYISETKDYISKKQELLENEKAQQFYDAENKYYWFKNGSQLAMKEAQKLREDIKTNTNSISIAQAEAAKIKKQRIEIETKNRRQV